MWNGMFKSYGTARVIPLSLMTAADWRWLEHENLRNIAKNNIADRADRLFGFADINILSKGQTKNRYLQPLSVEEAQEVVIGEHLDSFGHFTDVDLSPAAVKLEAQATFIDGAISAYAPGVFILGAVAEAQRREQQDLVDELNEMISSGFSDYYELDQGLSLTMELRRKGYDDEKLNEFVNAVEDAINDVSELDV